MEEEFSPTDIELIAASALLLLSHTPTTPPLQFSCKLWKEETPVSSLIMKKKKKKRTVKMTKSCEVMRKKEKSPPSSKSSLTTVDDNENYARTRRLNLMGAAASHCRELKLKVARRARSKVYRMTSPTGGDWKPTQTTWTKQPSMTLSSQMTTEGSCLTTGGTSEVSSARKSSSAVVEQKTRRSSVGSNHIRRRAEAIVRLLSRGGGSSEVRIRQLLGDNPDTSKALRMLLKMEEVKRNGAGGRGDPFIYKIAADINRSTVL